MSEVLIPLAHGTEVEEPGWQERALCAQTDPEAFFPEKGGSTREAMTRVAVQAVKNILTILDGETPIHAS